MKRFLGVLGVLLLGIAGCGAEVDGTNASGNDSVKSAGFSTGWVMWAGTYLKANTGPTVVHNRGNLGALNVFITGNDGYVWGTYRDHQFGVPVGMVQLPILWYKTSYAPAAVWINNNIAKVFMVSFGEVYSLTWNGSSGWDRDWEKLFSAIISADSAPSAASIVPGEADVFFKGTDNALWHMWYHDGRWEHQTVFDTNIGYAFSMGGVITSGPSALAYYDTRSGSPAPYYAADVFARGLDNVIWNDHFGLKTNWIGFQSYGGIRPGGNKGEPAAQYCASGWGGFHEVYRDTSDNVVLDGKVLFDGKITGKTSAAPAIDCAYNYISVFIRGLDGQLWEYSQYDPDDCGNQDHACCTVNDQRCRYNMNCESGICRAPAPPPPPPTCGGLGQCCNHDGSCNAPLVCRSNVCQSPSTPPPAQCSRPGDACCKGDYGFYCNDSSLQCIPYTDPTKGGTCWLR